MDTNECVRLFNERFKVGDVFLWRVSTSSRYDLVELKGKAYNNHNNAVAFIKELSCFISVDPIFIKETNRDEIVVWLDEQYIKNKSFSIPSNTHRKTITDIVNRKFGKKGWWSYDINPVGVDGIG